MTCLHNIRYKKLYDNKVFPLGSTEKLLSSTQNDTFSNPRRYSFLLKDAMILGKMFEGEGDNKKGFFVVTFKIFMYFCKNKKPGVITSIE